MEAIIKTSDKKTFKSILRFLRDLGIEVITREDKISSKKKEFDFFQSAGLWEGRNITAESLREKAWRRAK